MTAAGDLLRNRLWRLLGLDGPVGLPLAQTLSTTRHADHIATDMRLNRIPASYLQPLGGGPFPAVLYCHAHGGDYALGRHELHRGARWLAAAPAPDLIAAGFAVLALDMPGFGDRQAEGTESALTKAGLWRGLPVFGQMVADQLAGFTWLAAQPQIAANRIATLGTSMGGALSFWSAALEPRLAAAAHLCMLADMAPLIAAGLHDRHGPYLTVPGLLPQAEIGDVAALIAPRPQFVGHGARDAFTPKAARDPALRRLRRAYDGHAGLTHMVAPDAGHMETPDMRRAVIAFLTRHCAIQSMEERQTCSTNF